MSLPETGSPLPSLTRLLLASALCGLVVFGAGCTVQPLYGSNTTVAGTGTNATLSSIAVKPVKTRQALEVRNHLIFLLSGGAGQPADPRYHLDLIVESETTSAAIVQIATDNRPSAGAVTMTATYVITEAGTGDVLAKGVRSVTTAYDRPRQEFAVMRAERDAENRAAREVAELLRLAIVHELK